MIPHELLYGFDDSPTFAPTTLEVRTNRFSTSTIRGLFITLILNIIAFTTLVIIFETNRQYRQIFLKRYQKRFVEADRIPPEPSSKPFGWLFATLAVEERDVLHMVGLDAYMLLRYHDVCLRLCTMLSISGLIVLLPIYGTVDSPYQSWERYTILNVIKANNPSDRGRVWVTVLYAYAFSAYFCQILYREYHNFVIERLRCLQANHDGQVNDTTDNLPQKYYTIMLEKIPPHLRSEDKLYEFFDELFPGDVYNVEISLDLRELNAMTSKRNRLRDKLEKAIASYIATRKRPQALVKKADAKFYPEGFIHAALNFPWLCGNLGGISCSEYLSKLTKPERWGRTRVDAINYYTEKLIQYNVKTALLQRKCFEIADEMRKDIERKAKSKPDTRAAAAVESLNNAGNRLLKKMNDKGIESVFFNASTKKSVKKPINPFLKKENSVESNLSSIVSQNSSENLNSSSENLGSPGKASYTHIPNFDSESVQSKSVKPVRNEVQNPMHADADADANSDANTQRKKSISHKISSKLKVSSEKRSKVHINKHAKNVVNRAKTAGQLTFNQAKIVGAGGMMSVMEFERIVEMITVGAYYKYSSTAFVTFKSRTAETVAQQMVLSDDNIEISHGPNPHDIIWENVAIPKAQIITRNNITNIGLVIGSVFWSSLVTELNKFAKSFSDVESIQNLVSIGIILMFLLILPFIFDFIARYYEGYKLETQIQDTIMTRYFYYQLVNIYVTIGFGSIQLNSGITYLFTNPQLYVDLLGKTIPSLSLYFFDLLLVKIFTAIPAEMCRPFQLSIIFLLGTILDRKKLTRRELRTGAFFAWPMLYGWVYPQLLLVTLIVVTYACIAPILMPLGIMFFIVSYVMYKYQLLYVYVNDNQSLGFMWYAVFNRTLISLIFATISLTACFAVHAPYIGPAPFFLTLPLPVSIVYFWHYCEYLKKTSSDLSFGFAKRIDRRNDEFKANKSPIPQDTFKKDLYRQPTLMESMKYPEPYRKTGESASDVLSKNRRPSLVSQAASEKEPPTSPRTPQFRLRSQSINMHVIEDEVDDSEETLENYFKLIVLRRLCTVKNLEEQYRDSLSISLPNQQATSKLTPEEEAEIDKQIEHEIMERDAEEYEAINEALARGEDATTDHPHSHPPAIKFIYNDNV